MIKIIYEDNYLVVAIKPVGLSSQLDEKQSMVTELSQQLNCNIFPVHRLDKMVSGLIVYCKDSKTAGKLSKLIQADSFDKDYLAVAENLFTTEKAKLTDLLYYDRKKNKSFVVNKERNGVKQAILDYTVLQQIEDKALVSVHLLTGRTHQIRVQMANSGHPLAGDGKYGSKDNHCTVALFSYQLSFKHPMTNRFMYFKEYPENMYPWNLFDLIKENGE